jgi:hypothetical protein
MLAGDDGRALSRRDPVKRSWCRRMNKQQPRWLLVWLTCGFCVPAVRGADTAPPQHLTVGAVQMSLDPTLAANRDKIAGFIRPGKGPRLPRGCLSRDGPVLAAGNAARGGRCGR